MNTLGAVVTTALLDSLWQDVVVAGALAIVLAALGRSRPNVRYLLSCAALGLMIALPVATAVAAIQGRVAREVVPAARVMFAAGAAAVEPTGPIGRLPVQAWVVGLQAWTLPLWLVGVALFSLRLAGSGAYAASLRRSSTPASPALEAMVRRVAAGLRVSRPVAVFESSLRHGAATVGWLRPVVYVPAAAALAVTPAQLEALIAHELAHVRRHDYIVNLAQLGVETLCFYHPAVWWVSWRMRLERELCCDDAAVEWCGDPPVYARALVALAGAVPQPAVGASGGSLVYRVERLLGIGPARHAVAARGPLAAVALAFILVVGSAAWMHAQQGTPATSAAATLSGTVYDPFDSPADNTPITLSGANDIVESSSTDASGHFRFEHLPPGRYTFSTPITDAFVPAITLVAGEDRQMDVRLRVEEVVVDVEVCDGCRQVGTIRAPLAASAPGIPKNPLIVQAEPVEGWDAFNAATREYPASLKITGVDGTVIVDGRIGVDGVVEHPQGRVMDLAFRGAAARVCQPNIACADALAAAAVALVQQERWRPATVRGTPVDVPLHVTVEYTLARR